jgi:hypothetical protein
MRSLMITAAIMLLPIAAAAQTTPDSAPHGTVAGRPVRIIALPTRPLPSRLTGTLVRFAADSLTLKADSVQVLTSPTDSTITVRLPCGACVEARLAVADLARVELGTPPPPDAWKRTRRRGVIGGAVFGGALAAGIEAARGGGNVAGAAIPAVILGAWLGGTIGAAWPHPTTWETIHEAPSAP